MNRIISLHSIVRRLALLAVLGASATAHADGKIYRCSDAEGHKEYTDLKKNNNCTLLDLPGVITAPVPKPAGATRSTAPAWSAPVTTPGDFPRVDSAQQKARDGDRRDILQDELKSEEHKLAELKLEFNGGEPERNGNERNYAKYQERVAQLKENINRTEKNIEALKREMGPAR